MDVIKHFFKRLEKTGLYSELKRRRFAMSRTQRRRLKDHIAETRRKKMEARMGKEYLWFMDRA